MMGWRIPNFVEIGPPVPEKIFEGFLTYMEVANTLVSLFSIEKPELPYLTLPQNRSRSLKSPHLNNL